MDFVQRNLINERNNLQIELAKANILIAQLSEEKKIVGEKPKQAPYGEKPKAEQGKNGKYEPKENPKPKSMSEEHDLSDPSLIYHSERRDGVTPDAATLRLRARERADHAKSLKDTEPKKLGIGTDGKKMTRAATEIEDSRARYEQAEYISGLENVIVSIAEQLGVSPAKLIEDIQTPGRDRQMQRAMKAANATDREDIEKTDHREKSNWETLYGINGKKRSAVTSTGVMLPGIGPDGVLPRDTIQPDITFPDGKLTPRGPKLRIRKK
jgi:hypothetical protein